MSIRVGVDVGGTNTDAVAFSNNNLVAVAKSPTTQDVTSGVTNAIQEVIKIGNLNSKQISAVMVGTTHFVNALIESKHLLPTAVIRLCGKTTQAILPFRDWPLELRKAIQAEVFLLEGGHEFDGRTISALSQKQVDEAIHKIIESGVTTVAISSVFAPLDNSHETIVAQRFSELAPNISVSISSEIGRIGLLERENATILNASLRGVADKIIPALYQSIKELGIVCQLFISQNDGTLMSAAQANRYPITTFASGPTNSMRGAAFLSGKADCAVIDIGGTTTDIGILRAGYPRETSSIVNVNGVRTNFRMPDVVSIGLGGGSIVRNEQGLTIGPDSVGYQIRSQALIFGGSTLTATDLAVASGRADIGDPSKVKHLDSGMVRDALELIQETIGQALETMTTSPEPITVVLVGGGHLICGDEIANAKSVVRPSNLDVANAVGSAISQVGSQVDQIVSITPSTRESVIEALRKETIARCESAGAMTQSIEIIEMEEIPLAYLPTGSVRMRMRAVGNLDFSKDLKGIL